MSDVNLHYQPTKAHSTKGTLTVSSKNDSTPLHCDTFDLANDKHRTAFIKKLENKYKGISPEKVNQTILRQIKRITTEKHRAEKQPHAKKCKDPLEGTPPEVKEAALAMLKSKDLFQQISADIRKIGIAGEENLGLLSYIIMTSRLLDKPLCAIVQGAAASGKSYIIESVAKLMPPEARVQAHDFSDQALYYLPTGSLVHRIVISGERTHEYGNKDGYAQDNTKAFREMVASGELRKAVTIKGENGGFTTVTIYQQGPIAYLESSTATSIHDEDATRLLPLVTDESASQTQRIIEAQQQAAKGQTLSETERQEIIQRHYTLQRLLRSVTVRIPYIDKISLPATNIATRRTYEQFISAIKTVAILRQNQKRWPTDRSTGQMYIKADEIDYEIAYELMKPVLARTYSPLNQQSRDLFRTVLDHTGINTPFTQSDCEQWGGVSNTTIRRRLSPLIWAGVMTVNNGTKPYQYRVTNKELAETSDLDLPTPEDIAERDTITS